MDYIIRGKNMNNSRLKFEKYFVNTSKFILLIVGCDVLISSILFMIGISISRANLLFSIIIAFCLYKKIGNCSKNEWIKTLFLSLIIISISIIINWNLYEIAYDGNLYHKFATGILKMGYNPVYDRVSTYLNELNIPIESWYKDDVWVECYPKASWIFDASIYVWTNWIESSKVFNSLIMFSCVGISLDYFLKKLSKINSFIISLIFSITPTSLSMVFSFYLDGALGNLLFISIVLLLKITDEMYNHENNHVIDFILLACSIILCGNLKISGLGFEAIFCAMFFFWWIFKRKEFNLERKIFRISLFYSITVIFTILVVGWGTYINNILHYGNILYPMGMEGFDIANNLKSVGLENKKPLVQILCMIFVRTTTREQIPNLEWKVPFTVDFEQIKHCTYDVIRGGAGVFYSGILILGILIYVHIMRGEKGKKYFDKTAINSILIISIILLTLIPAGGQVRYSPYVFYFVNLTIYYLMLCTRKEEKIKKVVLSIMVILLTINVIPFTNYYFRFIQQKHIEQSAYVNMRENENGVYINTKLPGVVFNLKDRNIEYEYLINEKLNYHLDYLEFEYSMRK